MPRSFPRSLADAAAADALPPRARLRLPRPPPGAAVLAAGAAQETASSSIGRKTGEVDRRASTTLRPLPVKAAWRSTRRLWSEDEVASLIAAVNSREARFCESAKKWTTVASKVAGRSARQCELKAQYLRRTGKGSSLLPAWTPEEDAELWGLAQALRNGRERAWTSVAARITGRSRKAVVGRLRKLKATRTSAANVRAREDPEVRERVQEQDAGAAAAVKPRWTRGEVDLLGRLAVSTENSGRITWKAVAAQIPGRRLRACVTKACRLNSRSARKVSVRRPWTAEETASLSAELERRVRRSARNVNWREFATAIGRDPSTVERRCRELRADLFELMSRKPPVKWQRFLGDRDDRQLTARVEAFDLRVPVPLQKRWSFDEDTILLSWANKSRMRDYNEIAYTLGRSTSSCQSRLSRLNGKNVSLISVSAQPGGRKTYRDAPAARAAATPVSAKRAPEACDPAGVASGASGAIPEGYLQRSALFGAGDANATGGLLLCKTIAAPRFWQPPRRFLYDCRPGSRGASRKENTPIFPAFALLHTQRAP